MQSSRRRYHYVKLVNFTASRLITSNYSVVLSTNVRGITMSNPLPRLLLAIALIAFVGCSNELTSVNETPETLGEAAGSFQSFSEMAEAGMGISKAVTSSYTGPSIQSLEDGSAFYYNRHEFENEFEGRLAREDFSGSNFPASSVGSCAGSIDQATGGNGCYPVRREILRNISVDNTNNFNDPAGMAVLTDGFFGVSSTVVGPNFFSDNTRINFGIQGVNAAGFDLIDPFGDSQFTLIIFQSGEFVTSRRVSPGFIGFITERSILQVTIVSSSGTGAELIDNFTYDGINTRP